MYEAFFSLGNRPFLGAPSIERYFPGGASEHARLTLMRCVERGQGVGLLIGPAGTGKTLICQMLADQFQSMFRVVLLANSRLNSRRALLQNILFELGLPYRGLDDGELRLSLIGHLESPEDGSPGMLLIVDEADAFPGRLFEELRGLTNVVRGGQPLVRLVLAGGAALEERFAHPKLESLNQRVAARCYLQPLSRDETRHYVRGQIGAVGGQGDSLFPDEATTAIFHATDGIPRLINQVCDAVLMLAAQERRSAVDGKLVERAWAELQQLPAPWQTMDSPAEARGASSVVEFGQLDDDDEVTAHLPARDVNSPGVPCAVDASSRDVDVIPRCEEAWPESFANPLGGVVVDSWLPEPSVESCEEVRAAVAPIVAESNAPPAAAATAPSASSASSATPATSNVDVFGDGFSEEVVVSDRYAKMEVDAIRARIRVSCPQGRDIAWSLRNVGRGATSDESTVAVRRVLPRPVEAYDEESAWAVQSRSGPKANVEPQPADEFKPIDEPAFEEPEPTTLVMPTSATSTSSHVVDEGTPGGIESPPYVRLLPDDDRDLLVAEEDGARREVKSADEGRVVRREYRQLFARLRRR